MLDDPTESIRHELRTMINSSVTAICEIVGTVRAQAYRGSARPSMEHDELARDFEVLDFSAPLVIVRRRADAVLGSLFFSHEPRFHGAFALTRRGAHQVDRTARLQP